MKEQLQKLDEQNQRLKSLIVRLTNSLNMGLTKTLIEPLNNAVPALA